MIYRDISEEQLIRLVTDEVIKALGGSAACGGTSGAVNECEGKSDGCAASGSMQVPAGISMRHVHLNREAIDLLFGRNYYLTKKKDLSQPGQYAAEECVDVIGPKGELKKVRILGPERKSVQVELAQTDCRTIGVAAPLRLSGDLKGAPGITLRGPRGEYRFGECVIIADRHIHLSESEAAAMGLKDGDLVRVRIDGIKPGVMGNVHIRAGSGHRKDFHIDTDDGNAFLIQQGQPVTIIGKEGQI